MSMASGEVTNKITMKISWNFLSSLTMTIQGMLNEKDMSEVEHVTMRNVRTVQHEGSILNQAAAPSVNVCFPCLERSTHPLQRGTKTER